MAYVPQLFDQARAAATVGEVAGVKLYRDGKNWRGQCPLCKASKDATEGGAFWVNGPQTKWMCFGGCADKPTDVIELEFRLHYEPGQTLRDAALRLLRHDGLSPAERARRQAASAVREREEAVAEAARIRFRAQLAVKLWREGRPAGGTPAEDYFRACGFSGWPLAQVLRMVRYHPRAYHSGDPNAPIVAPAIVGLQMTPHGATGGVHVTYLRPDGKAKSDLRPARKKWGPSYLDRDGVRVRGGVWLSPPTTPGPLMAGEGYENVLAAATLYGQPCGMVAALDLSGLQGRLLPDDEGRLDILTPRLDLERPAFTWPRTDRVIVCVDHDMKPYELALMSDPSGGRTRLDATDRALLCALMAERAWTSAGSAEVRFAYPKRGLDIRDQLVQSPRSPLDVRRLADLDWPQAPAFT